MPPTDVQAYLIQAFSKWGMPKSIRVDNGKPLGDPQRKSLPALCLWLEAVGVQVIYNRPRRPTDNSKVERMQRTTKNWAEIKTCENYKELSQQLQRVCLIQREKFKVSRLKNKTRKETYPELYHNPRTHQPDFFEPQKAYQRLANWVFARSTSQKGQFTLYNNFYYLGRKFKHQSFSVKFDPQNLKWKVWDAHGNHIKDFESINFSEEHLKNLTVCQRTYKKDQTLVRL